MDTISNDGCLPQPPPLLTDRRPARPLPLPSPCSHPHPLDAALRASRCTCTAAVTLASGDGVRNFLQSCGRTL